MAVYARLVAWLSIVCDLFCGVDFIAVVGLFGFVVLVVPLVLFCWFLLFWLIMLLCLLLCIVLFAWFVIFVVCWCGCDSFVVGLWLRFVSCGFVL